MRKVQILINVILMLLISSHSLAFDIRPEIKALNAEFNSYKYPILVIDKHEARNFLKKWSFESLPEKDQAKLLAHYFEQTFQTRINHHQAINILPYMTQLSGSAVALPFGEQGTNNLCVVLPSDNQGDHLSEIQRFMGHEPSLNIYKNLDFEKLKSLLSLEELRLLSLYHELSHCLDPYYTVKFHQMEPDPHMIHQGESFAEVNALFMLAQRKNKKNLGIPRALMRGLYSRFYGPYLATQPPSMAGDAYNKGGTIYFLSFPILEAQMQIESFSRKIHTLNLAETLALSKDIVEFQSIKSRSFQALHTANAQGEATALGIYKDYAMKHPDLFFVAYKDLVNYLAFMKSLEPIFDLP